MNSNISQAKFLTLIVVCAAINLSIGFVVATLKLPFYLDSVGTVLATALGGFLPGMACGIVSVLIGSIYTPTLWAYMPTAITIAFCVSVFTRYGYLYKWLPTVIFSLLLGVASAIVSAPITTYVWKGVSFAGTDALTGFFSATGQTLLESVVLGGLSTDPIDKLFTSIIAFFILFRIPKTWYLRNEKK